MSTHVPVRKRPAGAMILRRKEGIEVRDFDGGVQIFSDSPVELRARTIVALPRGAPSLSGQAVPVNFLGIILRYSPTVVIAKAEVISGSGVSLHSSRP